MIRLTKERGLSLAWAEYVGDDRERITATSSAALRVVTWYLASVE